VLFLSLFFFFFFQAEDGIRDYKVTGVQTCALPISLDLLRQGGCALAAFEGGVRVLDQILGLAHELRLLGIGARAGPAIEQALARSEERRVGKEGRSGGWRCD